MGGYGLPNCGEWIDNFGHVAIVEHIAAMSHSVGPNWVDPDGEMWVPLYEPRMVDFYDPRAASYASRGEERVYRVLPETTEAEHKDVTYFATPYYWVKRSDAIGRVPLFWKRDWLLGIKGVTSALNERTVIPSPLPFVGVGHNMPLIFSAAPAPLAMCLIAVLSSLVLDYIACQKFGSTYLSFFYIEQFPIPAPANFSADDLEFLLPRVVELIYTCESMRPLVAEIGFDRQPFEWDEERRAWLRAELDVYIARMYGLGRDQMSYILDPSTQNGVNYPSETFRVLREREIREMGEFRTARLILDAWDRLSLSKGDVSTAVRS
jgi:hypothetical protein